MAEMGSRGLSEQWLMRRAGDLHGPLLARALAQQNAVFICSEGKPLYATFLDTSLRLAHPERPRLCGTFALTARLWGLGRTRSASEVAIRGVACPSAPCGWSRHLQAGTIRQATEHWFAGCPLSWQPCPKRRPPCNHWRNMRRQSAAARQPCGRAGAQHRFDPVRQPISTPPGCLSSQLRRAGRQM